ncbi:hypothetical protein [Bacillus sp. OK048]|uniref:hypothetical protein n=1 Tax=Bacillus sp. OK048 TaxID=1882761 RepID=UPI00088863A4|nr:hypothetical protein [Bacillus sp. OK048]SDN85559.1 hypothetical protein SAMN05443253_1221 [Bacillus sp. OK048]
MNKKFIAIILVLLVAVAVVSYMSINSSEETTYAGIMGEILGGDTVESIIIKNFENPEPKNHLLIDSKEIIRDIVEQPANMVLKKTDDYPDELYLVSIHTNTKYVVLTLGENGIIRFNGDLAGLYSIEGENTLLPILYEITK